jgi:hypothetical protein
MGKSIALTSIPSPYKPPTACAYRHKRRRFRRLKNVANGLQHSWAGRIIITAQSDDLFRKIKQSKSVARSKEPCPEILKFGHSPLPIFGI